MKLKISAILFAFAATFAVLAFAPKADVYVLDTTKSTITWEGKKATGAHNGTLLFKSGTLGFSGKALTQGGFVVDMTSLKDADGSAGLEKHLKADDFFGTEKFPASAFIIKKVTGKGTDVTITGDITIKGKTQSITFPAKLTWNADNTVTAVADKITIDRTKFGIQYSSKSVFPSIGDKFIYDDFTIGVKIVAKKG